MIQESTLFSGQLEENRRSTDCETHSKSDSKADHSVYNFTNASMEPFVAQSSQHILLYYDLKEEGNCK